MPVAINDTSPEAERVLIAIFRNMSMQDKWRQLQSLYRAGRDLHEMGNGTPTLARKSCR
ncbi:MAG TPA: hypothetical protein VG125_14445 [Pirellulales bacterium]|jgi:hypothetical protein|nr:hypothetical protein [Pirellulales bacterium]